MNNSTEFSANQSGQNRPEIVSVSQLNRISRQLLETHLPLVWVEAEISNLARPSSGHWYFTLKDEQAQVRCAMFRNRNQSVRFAPENGNQVLIRARVSIYEGRGDYQLIAEHMEEAGLGALQRAYEALKGRLEREGLFAPEHKLPLPDQPQHIAVITSPTGAAIRDILSIAKRRYPSLPITVIPVPVQGEQAAPAIIQALQLAERCGWFDTIILARGGGSIEDLWAFNDERLARAIFQSTTPVISAVGHEIDFTIADFVADLRAPTPSAAAELSVPNTREILQQLRSRETVLAQQILNKLKHAHQRLEGLNQRLRHPGEKLRHQAQQLDQLEARLLQGISFPLKQQQTRQLQIQQRLTRATPQHTLRKLQREQTQLTDRLKQAMSIKLNTSHQTLHEQAHVLNSVSPLATLERGFSALTNDSGQLIKHHQQVSTGETLNARLGNGRLRCEVIASEE
ncbi:exodeoxyribonuclease VII large subunit [Gilvimarinus sp. 1_MG-2023]|uniref:exodeoxyribonuclease VII large subunit n=1 Tax=Gilvimarinus sp. 1_MG-2023 TaxID=3062638 RepID=UPI0026E3CE19|nr:exodeoxyribonuclease VII large subunit [Gilvimarinus sp. 1_MG-2023]MDO6746022.1 exodeoxyribonuclease VII large subunit [Gilvimarinus sp. 1_MG-2023]